MCGVRSYFEGLGGFFSLSLRQSMPCSWRCFSMACLTTADELMNCLSANFLRAAFMRVSILSVNKVCIVGFLKLFPVDVNNLT